MAQYELMRVREAFCCLIGSLTPMLQASSPEAVLAYHALAKLIQLVSTDINQLGTAVKKAKLTDPEDEMQPRLLVALQAARRKMYGRLADLLLGSGVCSTDEQRVCFLFLIGYTNIQIKELEDELKQQLVVPSQK
jgi:hypothetical protein